MAGRGRVATRGGGENCFLKTGADAVRVQQGSVSGYARAGGADAWVGLQVQTGVAVHTTDELFKSWNIDAS